MKKRKDYDLAKIYKLPYIDLRKTAGDFQMPILKREKRFPEKVIDFCDAMRYDRFDCHVHFYLDDGKFERLWRNPERYRERMKLFRGVLTPDFSLYADMPITMQMWNVFRARLLGQMFQNAGINVIPAVSWSDRRSFSFCFDGLPMHGIVSVSSVGVCRNKIFLRRFTAGLKTMIEKIEPAGIVFYGKIPSFDFRSIPVREYQTTTFSWKNQQKDVHYKETP